MSEEPGILHADLDAFFASVEQRDDPGLRGRPVLVGGDEGVIVAASYEAKRFGIGTPTNARAARMLCPNVVIVPPRFDAYLEASKAVFDCFHDITPNVEGLSIDEAFLDVRGARRLLGQPSEIARRLRADVRERVGLPVSVGIATTKFLAKVASASAKPDGVLLVPDGEELAFLHPLPIERIWGVGPKTSEKLHAIGVTTVAQMAEIPETALAAIVGRAHAAHLHSLAWNRDPRPVRARARRRSIGSQSALGRPRTDLAEIDAALLGIVDRVARRLRADERLARTLTLRLRFPDRSLITRSATLPQATDSTTAFVAAARELLAVTHDRVRREGITLIGLATSNLVSADTVQMALPFTKVGEGRPLDSALDAVREKFGNAAVTRAALVNRRRFQESFGEPLVEPR